MLMRFHLHDMFNQSVCKNMVLELVGAGMVKVMQRMK